MPGRTLTYVCVPCRNTAKRAGGTPLCSHCGEPMLCAGTRWRAPKRTDTAAWRRIEHGNWLTEAPRSRAEVPTTPADRDRAQVVNQRSQARPRSRWSRWPDIDRAAPPTRDRWARPTRDQAAEILRRDPLSTQARDLAASPDARVRRAVAAHPVLHPDSLADLLADKDPAVLAALLRHPQFPEDRNIRTKLARSPHPQVRVALAERGDTAARLLTRLAADKDPAVQQAAATNPATPTRALRKVLLHLVPTARDPELAGTDHRAAVLVALRDTGSPLTVSEALHLADLVT